jgi:hypothetical protein
VQKFYRRVIRIKAADSPNVRLCTAQVEAGREPDDSRTRKLYPGVITYDDYLKRRKLWDKVRQCVGLDAEFYLGSQLLLYPPDWLNLAEEYAQELRGKRRQAKGIGIDPAEGGDSTAMSAVDELGLIEQVSRKTPDTNVIVGEALAFMKRHGAEPSQVCIDAGGGGKQHADRLRSMGFPVRVVRFGETLALDPKRGLTLIETRLENKEERYEYVTRRAQMAGELRELLDPSNTCGRFAIPEEYRELRRQMAPIPLTYDAEGRLYLIPKDKKDKNSKVKTLKELLGRSPDEWDSLLLAVHAMLHKKTLVEAGAI